MRRLPAIFFICFLFSHLQAQHFEVGLMGGASNYQGDLMSSGISPLLKETHIAFGGFARYNINDWMGAKFSVNYGQISGDDANSSDNGRVNRNLDFRSNILEFSLIGEFNILGFQPYNLERVFSPYVFAGITYYKFNPQAEYQGQWYDLRSLGTEGQGLASYPERDFYDLTQFAIPVGAGLKYAINDLWTIGIEVGIRRTFTDYLDDVSTTYVDADELLQARGGTFGEAAVALSDRNLSGATFSDGQQRGDPSNNDWYTMSGITISYNFLDNGLVGSRGRRGKNGCPTF